MEIEGNTLHWITGRENDYPIKSPYLKDATVSLSVESNIVPILLPGDNNSYRGMNHRYGYFWKGPEDNERIAKALVATVKGDRIKGDFKPNPGICFIASAIYGESAAEVIILQDFRDNILAKSVMGNYFTRFYYKLAPGVLPYIHSYQLIRVTLKGLLRIIVPIAFWCTQRKPSGLDKKILLGLIAASLL